MRRLNCSRSPNFWRFGGVCMLETLHQIYTNLRASLRAWLICTVIQLRLRHIQRAMWPNSTAGHPAQQLSVEMRSS